MVYGDALGRVRQLTNATANVTLARDFEPYGSTFSSGGDGSTVMAFTGEILDASGLTFLRARYPNDKLDNSSLMIHGKET